MMMSSGVKTYIASSTDRPHRPEPDEIGEVDPVEGLLRLQEDDAEIERAGQERQEIQHEVGEQPPLLHRVADQEDGVERHLLGGEVAHHHQRAEGEQRALHGADPVALEPALADAHHRRGQAEAEHGEAHDQRAEMRPAADREHAHDADLQRDDAAGHQSDGQVEGERRTMVEVGTQLRDVHGSDVVVMGCAGMARYRKPLQEAIGIPVVEPTQAAVAAAIGRVRLAWHAE